ncbi:MAG TPA: RNA methyltransferase [Clostridiales bacterium]|nr:RNA methyltransferase [Clostridiales bacterium]
MKIVMTTLFGIEALTAAELTDLGYSRESLTVSDGQVVLDAGDLPGEIARTAAAAARLNVFLRTAERVLVQLAVFPAADFDTLFESTRALPWEDWLEPDVVFHINGYSRKSALFGISACQSLIKKAIVSRLLHARGLAPDSQLTEDPARGLIRIQFGIVADQVSIMVDTSGDGLHKRGYRPLMNEAPIRETLAAAILMVSHYRSGSGEALYDPCCGSGTIPIEAALMASQIAPGMNRRFAGEKWHLIGSRYYQEAREEAGERMVSGSAHWPDTPGQIEIFGADLDARAAELSQANAKRAGVDRLIRFRQADLLQLDLGELADWTGHSRHLVVCNPPYGNRLLDQQQAEAIYLGLGRIFLDRGQIRPDYRLSVLTPDEQFESLVNCRADKRRKLYNGMIRCTLYHYFKSRRM